MTDFVAQLPEWVLTATGRREPFDADRISQSLFAALEDLGQRDAFLAREMTDAVLYFLAQEGSTTLQTRDIAELIVKVVRELEQPALSQAYARRRERAVPTPAAFVAPDVFVREKLHDYTLSTVFGADLVSAHQEGLVELKGLDAPDRLWAAVVDGPIRAERTLRNWTALATAAASVSRALVFDSPEWECDVDLPAFFAAAREATGRALIVNLHAAEPPAWARTESTSPLFPASAIGDAEERNQRRREFLDRIPREIRIDWHLQASDFHSEPERELLLAACRRALEGGAIAFTVDRSRRPCALAEGVDRRQPAVFLEVGLNLPALWDWVKADAEEFAKKIPSLVRMAVSAGVQKRRFLRRIAEASPGLPWARGFLLDRARLVVAPAGIDEVVTAMMGQSLSESSLALDAACGLMRTLHEHVQSAGRSVHLNVALDSALNGGTGVAANRGDASRQLSALGKLYAVAATGTVWLAPPADSQELLELLREASKKNDVVRLRLAQASHQQPEFTEWSELSEPT